MRIELTIANPDDRAEVSKYLIKNGYRVCEIVKKIGSARKKILLVDRPEEKSE